MRPLDFMAGDFLENPWPVYAELRREKPVWWSPEIRMFCLARYDDVRSALTGSDFTVEYPFRISRQILGETLLDLDGPRHKDLRRAVQPIFLPGNVDRIEREIMVPVIESVLDELVQQDNIDFVPQFARKVPVGVICRSLGVPAADQEWVHHEMEYLIAHLDGSKGDFQRVSETRKGMEAYLGDLLDETHRGQGIGRSAGPLSPARCPVELGREESLRSVLLFLAAGIETSVAGLGNLMVCLLKHPEWIGRVRENPAVIPDVVSESLRWEPPQHDTVRFAARDTQLGGVAIRKGQSLKLLLASANRDETRFRDAHRFIPGREERTALSFGGGLHSCLGRGFALKELETSLSMFFRRVASFEYAGGAPPTISGATFRQPAGLPMRIKPR